MVAKKSSCKMLNGVKFCSIHHRLLIGGSHADVKSGDHAVSNRILAGNIHSRLKLDVVYCKTGNLFHKKGPRFL